MVRNNKAIKNKVKLSIKIREFIKKENHKGGFNIEATIRRNIMKGMLN